MRDGMQQQKWKETNLPSSLAGYQYLPKFLIRRRKLSFNRVFMWRIHIIRYSKGEKKPYVRRANYFIAVICCRQLQLPIESFSFSVSIRFMCAKKNQKQTSQTTFTRNSCSWTLNNTQPKDIFCIIKSPVTWYWYLLQFMWANVWSEKCQQTMLKEWMFVDAMRKRWEKVDEISKWLGMRWILSILYRSTFGDSHINTVLENRSYRTRSVFY